MKVFFVVFGILAVLAIAGVVFPSFGWWLSDLLLDNPAISVPATIIVIVGTWASLSFWKGANK